MSAHYTSPEEQAAHEARVRAAFAASDPSRDGEIPPPVVPITGAAAARTDGKRCGDCGGCMTGTPCLYAVRACRCDGEVWRRADDDDPGRCQVCGGALSPTPPAAARTEPAGEEVEALMRWLDAACAYMAKRSAPNWFAAILDQEEFGTINLPPNAAATVRTLRAQAERVAALEQERANGRHVEGFGTITFDGLVEQARRASAAADEAHDDCVREYDRAQRAEQEVSRWRQTAAEVLAVLAGAGFCTPEGTYRDDPPLLAADVARALRALREDVQRWKANEAAQMERAIRAERAAAERREGDAEALRAFLLDAWGEHAAGCVECEPHRLDTDYTCRRWRGAVDLLTTSAGSRAATEGDTDA